MNKDQNFVSMHRFDSLRNENVSKTFKKHNENWKKFGDVLSETLIEIVPTILKHLETFQIIGGNTPKYLETLWNIQKYIKALEF